MRKIEIKRTATNQDNVSERTIRYDLYIDGKYDTTFEDIMDAIDYKEKMEKENDRQVIEKTFRMMKNLSEIKKEGGYKNEN